MSRGRPKSHVPSQIEFDPDLEQTCERKSLILNNLGMIMSFTCIIPVPVYLIYAVLKDGKNAFLPQKDWLPAKEE